MKKQVVWASALVLALSLPLVGCSSDDSSDDTSDDTTEEEEATEDEEEEESVDEESSDEESSDDDFDAVAFYEGQWRGSVETTGESVYGTTSGAEQMLDIYLEADGTCSVVPLEAHADLLTDTGTWEGTETELILHLSDRDITLTVTGSATMSGDATQFDIADFDTINFDFYG